MTQNQAATLTMRILGLVSVIAGVTLAVTVAPVFASLVLAGVMALGAKSL